MKSTESNVPHTVEWYQNRIDYLSGFVTEERFTTFRKVVENRTRWMTVCMENTFHPQNASALIRHCDAFGIQDIHTIEALCKFRPNTDIVRGADKWITFHRHRSSDQALDSLKQSGYRIIATMPHQGDKTPEDIDVTEGKFALVFGTEHEGISPAMTEAADEFVRIPMCGFVESLNLSAAAAILIHSLSERIRVSGVDWKLREAERAETLFRWMMETVKDSSRILQKYESALV